MNDTEIERDKPIDGARVAIVIGTGEFEDSTFPLLPSTTQDAINLTRVLQNSDIGGYEVKMFVNSSSYNVNKAIEGFFKKRKRNDILLIYYSGHGILDEQGRLYLATVDTKMDLLRSTAISAAFINETLNRSRSRNQIMLLDCCYSGAFARGLADSRGLAVITASDALQYAMVTDDEELGQVSAFTKIMVKGLETGYADINLDGEISVGELYSYTYTHMKKISLNQIPRFWAFALEGDIVIANNCRKS